MIIEPSDELQTYIEDCEVCCQPIQIQFKKRDEDLLDDEFGEGDLVFSAEGTQQG